MQDDNVQAESMQADNQLLESIASLRRSSRIAIPFGLIGIALIMGMLYFSSQALMSKREQIKRADAELAEKRRELDRLRDDVETYKTTSRRTQAILEETSRDLGEIAASPGRAADAGKAQAAIERLAAADASLSAAQYNSTPVGTNSADGYGAMRIDVFYCEERGAAARDAAERLLGLKGDAIGRWRVRPLSKMANDSSGYRLRDNLVRYNADESAIAQKLQRQARATTRIELGLQQIAYPTPNYISVFVCGAAGA